MANINRFISRDFDKHTEEFLKCKINPLYFILNYVHVKEIGGSLKLTHNLLNPKQKRVIKSLVKFHRVILMASRQLGKALEVNTLIPMYDGSFKKIVDLEIGDEILDHRGLKTTVINKTEIFKSRPSYRLLFINTRHTKKSEYIIADENHEWFINEDYTKTYTTKELYQKNEFFKINANWVLVSINPIKSQDTVCIQVDNEFGSFLCTKNFIPTHNSTIAAAMLEWAANFYPGIPAIILNMHKDAALGNLEKIKFIHNHLPEWLKSPVKGYAERKTYFELKNNSIIKTFYSSTTTGPDQIARSMTSPILYIDEVAFIRNIDIAYRAAQPVLSKAKEQAQRNNYPYFILLTSTPNGTTGDGKFFYDMWSNSIDSDEIFDENQNLVENAFDIVNDPEKNGFVRVKYHWSEDPSKSEAWYLEQKRELNFDLRSINQEIDLIFIGSKNCIFSDEFLTNTKSKKPIQIIPLSHQSYLKLFKELDPKKYYLVGIDSAKSITGDYCAIEIFEYESFEQVGEFFSKIGSLTKFAEICYDVISFLNNQVDNRVLVGVENNSIGSAIIEFLESKNLSNQLYLDDNAKDNFSFGINTNSKTKDQMVTIFYDYVVNHPELIHSADLINQLSVIEKNSNGSVSAKRGYHDDLFMASCFCAYMKRKTTGNPKYLSLDYYKPEQELSYVDYILGNKNFDIMEIFKEEPDEDQFQFFDLIV